MSIEKRAASLREWAIHALAPLEFEPAPHHLLLLDKLERVATGEIDRLMVLMPPGSAKSTYASVLFPAWLLSYKPRSSIIAACHTTALAAYFGRRTRAIATENADFLGYGLASDNRAATNWSTKERGEYYGVGVRGPVTGRRADLIIIDDPVKSFAEADSATHRDNLWNWYRADLVTRLKPKGRIVLVMTRWHEDDLGGRLLESGDDWDVLRMPALSDAGEALWPAWESAEALCRKRAIVGPRVWSALYQQNPAPSEGALFPVSRVVLQETEPSCTQIVRAWDLAATAATAGRDPDWTVGLKLGRDGGGRCTVLDVVRLRGGPHDVEEAILQAARTDGRGVAVGLPQDPGQAGKQQVSWLSARLGGHRIVATPETGSKITRAAPVASQVEAGNLAILAAPWNRAFLDELRDFPHGRKDDQVDALSRAYTMLADTPLPARRTSLAMMPR